MDLAQLQYINGVIGYIDVLDAQRSYFDAQVGLSNAALHKVIIDSPLCKRAKRDFYRRYVSSLGAEYSLIFFDTPLELLKKRLRKRNLTPGAMPLYTSVLPWCSFTRLLVGAGDGFTAVEGRC